MSGTHFSIKKLPEDDRPREKLLRMGPEYLSDSELLAVLIGSGTREFSALDVGRVVVNKFRGLTQLARAKVGDLLAQQGIGNAKAAVIVAAFELGRRKMMDKSSGIKFDFPHTIATYLRPKLVDKSVEHFMVLYLNGAGELIEEKTVAIGGRNNLLVDPKVIMMEALKCEASSLVFAHNHPSGESRPSRQDHVVTQRLVQAASFLEIKVMDHVIIGQRGYYSYAEQGRLCQFKSEGMAQELRA